MSGIQVTVTVNESNDSTAWWTAVSQAPRAVPVELKPLFVAGTPVVLDPAAAGRALDWAASLPGWSPAADETYPLRFVWSGEATPAEEEATRLQFALYRAEAEVESLRAEVAALRGPGGSPRESPCYSDEAKVQAAYGRTMRLALASGRAPADAHADALLVVYGLGLSAEAASASAPAPRPGFFARLFGSRS